MPNQTTHVYNIMLHLLLRNFKTSTQCVFTQDQVLPTAPEATTATATVSTSVPSEQPHAISGTIPQDDRIGNVTNSVSCLLYTSPSPRDATLSRMPSSA